MPKTRVRREGGKQVRKRLGQSGGRGDVVGTVDDEPGILADTSTRAGQLSAAKPRTTSSRATSRPGLDLGETVEARQHDGDVVGLVRTEQREGQSCPSPGTRSARRRDRPSGEPSGGTGGMSSYRKSLSISRSEHRRCRATRRIAWLASPSRTPLMAGRPRLRIPAFSVAIAASVLPSCSRVVERDARDDRQDRTNHVRRVEPAAQADLEHDRPDLAAGEVQAGPSPW